MPTLVTDNDDDDEDDCIFPGEPGRYEAKLPLLLNGELKCPYRYLSLEGILRGPSLVFSQSAVVCDAIPLNMEISREITITPIDYPRYNSSLLLFSPLIPLLYYYLVLKAIFQVDLGYPVPECLHSILDFVGSEDVELVVTAGATRHAKLQANRHHQQTNTQLFTGRMPFLSPNQQCQSTEGKHTTTIVLLGRLRLLLLLTAYYDH